MTIEEYEVKFMKLAKFVPRLVKEEDRVHKFERELRTRIMKQVVPYELMTFMDVVNKALMIERKVNEVHAKRETNLMICKERIVRIPKVWPKEQ